MEAALIVDTDEGHRTKLLGTVRASGRDARSAASATEALRELTAKPVDLLLLDAALTQDAFRSVLSAAFSLPTSPVVIAMGSPLDAPATAFSLAKAGVHAYLSKPLEATALERCLSVEARPLEALAPSLRAYTGRVGLREAVGFVRESLVTDALHRSQGSRRAAARILGVTRAAVQKFVREREDGA